MLHPNVHVIYPKCLIYLLYNRAAWITQHFALPEEKHCHSCRQDLHDRFLMGALLQIDCRASEYSGRWTFGELIHYFFGRPGSWALRLFIFINNAGEFTTSHQLSLEQKMLNVEPCRQITAGSIGMS